MRIESARYGRKVNLREATLRTKLPSGAQLESKTLALVDLVKISRFLSHPFNWAVNVILDSVTVSSFALLDK